MWFNQEKSKLESGFKKDGHVVVNFEDVMDDYFEQKKDAVTGGLMKLLGLGGRNKEDEESEDYMD